MNKEDTVLVVTSYPNPANGRLGKREFNAVGWHSEHILPYLAKRRKVLIAAEDIGTKKSFSVGQNMLVKRIWQKGNPLSLIELTKFILKQDKIKSVMVQFEFNVLGGTLLNLMLLAMLAILRVRGKKITFELHQVLTDIGELSRHINVTNPVLQAIYNAGLRVFYTAVGIVSNEVIVFEEELKTRLKSFVQSKKINVLCLPVERGKTLAKRAARKKLGLAQDEFIMLQFGFINGYKGIDWILAALNGAKNKGQRLLIAGGQNPYLKDRPFYQKYYNSILREAKKHAHVTYSDFVPEDKVYLYFAASDLVVLPYTACMSASGPFSRSLVFRKPVIISEKLADYAKSDDFAAALENTKLKKEDIVFDLKREDFLKMLAKARKNKAYYKKLVKFSNALAQARNIENITKNLDNILFRAIPNKALRFLPRFSFKFS